MKEWIKRRKHNRAKRKVARLEAQGEELMDRMEHVIESLAKYAAEAKSGG